MPVRRRLHGGACPQARGRRARAPRRAAPRRAPRPRSSRTGATAPGRARTRRRRCRGRRRRSSPPCPRRRRGAPRPGSSASAAGRPRRSLASTSFCPARPCVAQPLEVCAPQVGRQREAPPGAFLEQLRPARKRLSVEGQRLAPDQAGAGVDRVLPARELDLRERRAELLEHHGERRGRTTPPPGRPRRETPRRRRRARPSPRRRRRARADGRSTSGPPGRTRR